MSDPAAPAAVQIVPLGNGRYRIIRDGHSRIAFGAATSGVVWIFLDGRVSVVGDVRPPSSSDRAPIDQASLSAPMPATVAAINVAAGQTVATGDVMIVLEAMKMELPIVAPHAARVKAVLCQRGELVQPGVPLVEID